MKIKRCECKAWLIGNGVDDCHVGKIYALVIESITNVLAYTTKSNVFLFLENSLQYLAAFHAMVTEIALRIQIARMGIVNVDMSWLVMEKLAFVVRKFGENFIFTFWDIILRGNDSSIIAFNEGDHTYSIPLYNDLQASLYNRHNVPSSVHLNLRASFKT